jgi:cytochrome c oxidase accessory protein FixG
MANASPDSAPPPAGTSLYAAHEKIYPREVSGTFARLRYAAVFVLLGLYYGLPWLNWGGRQAVLFDLPARKFHIFGLTLWPQDFLFLTWLLILAALSLFFFTALAGRIWCGYACPQTVWTEAFLAMERLAEGKRGERLKLDRSPWTGRWIARKALKQVMWVGFAAWTGLSFVGFFSPIRELWAGIWSLSLGGWETFWVLFYGFLTYLNAGFLREQVCKYMCPYARFQSAMFDHDTLIVSYDPVRGEPRGARGKAVDYKAQGLGDCTDCTICVQVCPTGIDIRKGLQYECIACASCIDACDQVMDRMGYPRGLIRYTSERGLAGGQARVLRPRIVVYAALLTLLLTVGLVGLWLRQPIGLDVIRDRNAPYRVLTGGLVENVYSLRILNKAEAPHRFTVSVEPADALLVEVGDSLDLRAGEVRAVPARVRTVSPDAVERPREIVFRIESDAGNVATAEARFLVPVRDGDDDDDDDNDSD